MAGHHRKNSAKEVFCVTSHTTAHRRTNAEVDELLNASRAIVDSEPGQITIRHLFYRLVGIGLVPKTENGYKGLDRHLMNWRRSGKLPWGVFADNSRWCYQSQAFDGLEDALAATVSIYRRNLWADTPDRLEIWTEKDAIAGILYDVAGMWGVPVLPLRGFSSGTLLYNAAETIREATRNGKKTVIYYFGDHDPSGVLIDQKSISTLEKDFNVHPRFERLAVTEEQIKTFDLPTRATKKSTHSKNFKGGSVEIDAMPMQALRDLVGSAIVRHIDHGELERVRKIESEEKATLAEMSRRWMA